MSLGRSMGRKRSNMVYSYGSLRFSPPSIIKIHVFCSSKLRNRLEK